MNKPSYIKYFSNGELPNLNNHYCMCCHELKNNMEIFVFTLANRSVRSGAFGSMFIPFSHSYKSRKYYKSLAVNHGDNIYMCAECIMKLYKDISAESIKNMVVDKL